jgi:hypothetical protein
VKAIWHVAWLVMIAAASPRRRSPPQAACPALHPRPSIDPHAAFLVSRGLRTLGLRVERQNSNALALAQLLEAHPKVGGMQSHARATEPAAGQALPGFDMVVRWSWVHGAVGQGPAACDA